MPNKEAIERCIGFRKRLLGISQKLKALHLAPSFSCLEIVDALYFGVMKKQDTLILSKGHGAPAQYVALERLGVLESRELDLLCQAGGKLGGHPDVGNPGINASTGSLGHGLAIGMGMAMADRLEGEKRQVYVIISDGEIQEGSTWESLLLAPTFKLNTLTVCVDLNNFQTFAKMNEYHPNCFPVREKFEAFGWAVAEVDGHDYDSLLRGFQPSPDGKPRVVLAKTVKGKGVSYMENSPIWHFRSPNPEEYQQALKEIDNSRKI